MINSCIYDSQQSEMEQLHSVMKDIAAKLTDESWCVKKFINSPDLVQYLEENPLIDMFFYDVMQVGDIERLISLREKYQLSYVMLLAEKTLSPMKYIRPGVNAQSLLLRPFSREDAYETLLDFISGYVQNVFGKSKDSIPSLLIDTVDGRVNIPYERIFFIEAMEKKVYVCTGVDEYGFYDTLDSLCDTLPDNFKRCHRSFIVNSDKIKKVALSQNTIFLTEDYEVPLSRSYKSSFKGSDYGK